MPIWKGWPALYVDAQPRGVEEGAIDALMPWGIGAATGCALGVADAAAASAAIASAYCMLVRA